MTLEDYLAYLAHHAMNAEAEHMAAHFESPTTSEGQFRTFLSGRWRTFREMHAEIAAAGMPQIEALRQRIIRDIDACKDHVAEKRGAWICEKGRLTALQEIIFTLGFVDGMPTINHPFA